MQQCCYAPQVHFTDDDFLMFQLCTALQQIQFDDTNLCRICKQFRRVPLAGSFHQFSSMLICAAFTVFPQFRSTNHDLHRINKQFYYAPSWLVSPMMISAASVKEISLLLPPQVRFADADLCRICKQFHYVHLACSFHRYRFAPHLQAISLCPLASSYH